MRKKVKVSFDYPTGMAKEGKVDPSKPFVFFSVPSANEKEMNSYLNNVMNLLRLRQGENYNSCIELDDCGVNIYGSHACDISYFSSILDSISPKDFEGAQKQFRNINFVSYGGGNGVLYDLLVNIQKALLDKGFGEDRVMMIMSQISVLQIVDTIDGASASFPYVLTNTIHILQDSTDNSYWDSYDTSEQKEDFSKVFIEKTVFNKRVILVDDFGEGALQHDDTRFFKHYLGQPVVKALMSACLFEVVRNSLEQSTLEREPLNIDTCMPGIKAVIAWASEIESTCNKNLDDLSQEDMANFEVRMMDFMTKYVCAEPNIENATKQWNRDKYISMEAGKLLVDYAAIEALLEKCEKLYGIDPSTKVKLDDFSYSVNLMTVSDAIECLKRKISKAVDRFEEDVASAEKRCTDDEVRQELLSWRDLKRETINERLKAVGLNPMEYEEDSNDVDLVF